MCEEYAGSGRNMNKEANRLRSSLAEGDTMSRPILTFAVYRSTLIILVYAAILAIFAVACGGGSNDTVVLPSNASPAQDEGVITVYQSPT